MFLAGVAVHLMVPWAPPWLHGFGHTCYELLGRAWWGVLFGFVAVALIGRLPRELVAALLGRSGSVGGLFRAVAAGVALDLLFQGHASHIHINDAERGLLETIYLLLTSIVCVPAVCKLIPGGSPVLGYLVRGRGAGRGEGGMGRAPRRVSVLWCLVCECVYVCVCIGRAWCPSGRPCQIKP